MGRKRSDIAQAQLCATLFSDIKYCTVSTRKSGIQRASKGMNGGGEMCGIHKVCPVFTVCPTSRETWPHPVKHTDKRGVQHQFINSATQQRVCHTFHTNIRDGQSSHMDARTNTQDRRLTTTWRLLGDAARDAQRTKARRGR